MVIIMRLWEKYALKLNCPAVDKNLMVDTLIIGGGLAGISTLYFLNNPNCFLVEARKVGEGVTLATTGKLTFLQEDILYKLLAKDYTLAKTYLASQKRAIALIKKIIQKEKIDCDLDKSSSYLLAKNIKEVEKLAQVAQFLELNQIKTSYINYHKYYGIKVNGTYVFNPLKFLNALARKLKGQIFENTKIINVKKTTQGYECLTAAGFIITCEKIIFTCHYPFFLKPMFLPLNTTIEKSYIVVTKEKRNEHYNYITLAKPTFSFRYYEDGNRVYGIYLSSSHNTAIKHNEHKNLAQVISHFKLNSHNIVASWTNVDIITGDHLPYIGEINPQMYLATGFNTWGMTNSVLSGEIICDLIKGNANPYAAIFKTTRIKKYQRFYQSIGTNLLAFMSALKKNKKWYGSEIYFENKDGQRIGVYVAQDGSKHKVHAICPHLKCPLIFNQVDKTWDCPCHSSRFSIDGQVLKGPSKYDIAIKKD